MLSSLVGGILGFELWGGPTNLPILSTQLALTKEFIEFYNHGPFSPGAGTWGSLSPVPERKVNDNQLKVGDAKAFAPTLEELHQNLTLAVFSFPLMTTNTARANVPTWRPKNVYVYNRGNLLLSYGLGILATALAVAYGLYISLVINGASYTTRFSTFVRTLDWEQASTLVSGDQDGANPLSKTIAESKVNFGRPPHGTVEACDVDERYTITACK